MEGGEGEERPLERERRGYDGGSRGAENASGETVSEQHVGGELAGSREPEQRDQEEEDPVVEYHRVVCVCERECRCCAFNANLMCVGTLGGAVVVVSNKTGTPTHTFRYHNRQVTDLSLNIAGTYLASCAEDGKLLVYDLSDGVVLWLSTYSKALFCVAINPFYDEDKGSQKLVCVGGEDGELVLNRRGLFYNNNVTLHSGEGVVRAVRWQGQLIAWANARGVKVFDVVRRRKVTFVPAAPTPHNMVDGVVHRPSLCWADETKLFIGWGDTVKVVVIIIRGDILYGEVAANFSAAPAGSVVCGVCPFGAGGDMSVLTCQYRGIRSDDDAIIHHVISATGEVSYSDCVELRGCVGRTVPADFQLCFSDSSLPSYIVAPYDVIQVRRRGVEDQLVWLIERSRYEDAVHLASTATTPAETVQPRTGSSQMAAAGPPSTAVLCSVASSASSLADRVMMICVKLLLQSGQLDRAVALLRSAEHSQARWREFVELFDGQGGLSILADALPSPTDGAVDLYDLVLLRLAEASPGPLLKLLARWPIQRLHLHTLIAKIEGVVEHSLLAAADMAETLHCLALLYDQTKQHRKAVEMLRRVGSPRAYHIIEQHFHHDEELRKYVCREVLPLCETDSTSMLDILVEHCSLVDVQQVAGSLSSNRQLLHHYLKRLFYKNPTLTRSFHTSQVSLFAELEPPLLLDFLQRAYGLYDVQQALAVVAEQAAGGGRVLRQAEAFLLARTGRCAQALKIQLEELQDVRGAVNMVVEYRQTDLWEELMQFALPRPHCLTELLSCLDMQESEEGSSNSELLGGPTAAVELIKRLIKSDCRLVPDITVKLCRLFHQIQVQLELRRTSLEVSAEELLLFSRRRFSARKRAIAIYPHTAILHLTHSAANETTTTAAPASPSYDLSANAPPSLFSYILRWTSAPPLAAPRSAALPPPLAGSRTTGQASVGPTSTPAESAAIGQAAGVCRRVVPPTLCALCGCSLLSPAWQRKRTEGKERGKGRRWRGTEMSAYRYGRSERRTEQNMEEFAEAEGASRNAERRRRGSESARDVEEGGRGVESVEEGKDSEATHRHVFLAESIGLIDHASRPGLNPVFPAGPLVVVFLCGHATHYKCQAIALRERQMCGDAKEHGQENKPKIAEKEMVPSDRKETGSDKDEEESGLLSEFCCYLCERTPLTAWRRCSNRAFHSGFLEKNYKGAGKSAAGPDRSGVDNGG
eukprot:GHVS01108284.1.p1 GENE.GHVS01108284.1~~GHVS01108284.1.p1  ORF type:complete len:1213 (+),score=222.81 GHVS01108284.1:288-3926(+)